MLIFHSFLFTNFFFFTHRCPNLRWWTPPPRRERFVRVRVTHSLGRAQSVWNAVEVGFGAGGTLAWAWPSKGLAQSPPTLGGAKPGLGLEGATRGLGSAKPAWPLFCSTCASAQTGLQHHTIWSLFSLHFHAPQKSKKRQHLPKKYYIPFSPEVLLGYTVKTASQFILCQSLN
jgi:hypothetical protein